MARQNAISKSCNALTKLHEYFKACLSFPLNLPTFRTVSTPPPNPLEGLLSEFALGPAWARAKSEPVEKKFKESAEREFQPRHRDDRQGAGRGRDDRRQGGGSGRNDGGAGRQGGGGDRRQAGGGERRDDGRNNRGRPDFRSEEFAPAEGVTVTLIPEKHAIQLICKEIHQVARVYPLFDIAQIILAERSRNRAIFEISEKHGPFLRCKIEEAIYLTKEEALRHLLAAEWRDRFIEESTVEIDPPKGNFQSVAKCGISGVWLGPPNYHGYQTEIRRLHRELFSSMSFEAYSAKVRTERSEEAVNAWLDSMKNQTRWRILSDEESAARAAAKNAQSVESAVVEQPVSPEETASEEAAIEETTPEEVIESQADPVSEETETPAEESAEAEESSEEPTAEVPAENEPKWFTDRAEFERALSAEILEKAFHSTHKAKVTAGIPGKHLSPGLLARLKGAGNHARKHAATMIPAVCKLLESEHMPVFKRKGKLFTGPARPHALAADAVLAPRPAQMVAWIRENNPAKLEGLWNHVLPEGASAPPAEYAADLFWLLQQGHILLFTDDTLAVQEQPKLPEPKKPKAPKPPRKPKSDPITSLPENSNTLPEVPIAELEVSEPLEIPKESANYIPETISETASKLIESAIAAAVPESPVPIAAELTERPVEDPRP